MSLLIREEGPHDHSAIYDLNAAVFETAAEARLVDALRAAGALKLSLLAERGGALVGHIAFSPVTVHSAERTVPGIGLAPMAVRPGAQRTGVGGRLIADGLDRLRAAGHSFCVVLGHSDYYPRHGFVRASTFGMRWEHPAPDDAFMVQALLPGGLDGAKGVVRYRSEFDAV